jgi:hypothetical protein
MHRICLFAFLPAVVLAQPVVPRTWTAAAVAALELPLADPKASPVHLSEEAYYQIPARVIYKTYPVYHPDHEPRGYMEWLAQQEPAVAFDASALKSEADWVKAGEIVFNAPTSFGPVFFGAADVRDREFYKEAGMPVAKDGTVPFARWVIRKKGTVELGSMGCNTCHTRVMPDGTVVAGAQGNNPGDRQGARMLRRAAQAMDATKVLERIRGFARQFEMPWLPNDLNARARTMPLDSLIAAGEAIPPGVTARSNTSMFVPPQIPDLIGVKDRRFLDHTGVVRHRAIGDLMRYSSLVQDVVAYARYGDSPARAAAPGQGSRYSDEQLYALALFLYSLKPPSNPNRFDEAAGRGRTIFERERCGTCHAPPLYTNNKIIPVEGFRPAAGQKERDEILERRLGTDPRYTLQSRKGTGYYKVPSLKGVWYRGPLEHNGSVATLEDWFDPARLRSDYVPTGFKGGGVTRRAVPGHEFGLKLSERDKANLIAFLRTL